MEKVIKKLEALKNEAFMRGKDGHPYYNGQYSAYHTALELIKMAKKGEKASV